MTAHPAPISVTSQLMGLLYSFNTKKVKPTNKMAAERTPCAFSDLLLRWTIARGVEIPFEAMGAPQLGQDAAAVETG